MFLLAFSIFDKDRNLFPTFTKTFKSAKYNHKKVQGCFQTTSRDMYYSTVAYCKGKKANERSSINMLCIMANSLIKNYLK